MFEDFFISFSTWIESSLGFFGPFLIWPLVFLWGENGAIIAFVFSAQGLINPVSAIIFAFLGTWSADLFWYGVTTKTLRPWFQNSIEKHRAGAEKYISLMQLTRSHPYFVLVILKFLMGVRLVLTLYILTTQHIPFRKYFFCTFLGNILFILVLFPLGWLLGRGLSNAFSIGHSISSIATALLIIGIGIQIFLAIIRSLRKK